MSSPVNPPGVVIPDSGSPIPVVDFRRQYVALRPEILAALERVCDSQQFILGKEVIELESAIATLCTVSSAVGCSSGTDALWLALAAAGIGDTPSQSVLTTPFSFFASASCILRAGARPVFADIDPRTFNLDFASVAQVLGHPGTPPISAVLPVHLYGQCADMTACDSLQQQHGFLVIEDAAQAIGALWQDRPAGSLGLAAAFSFYPTKNLSAFGDAGILTTNNTALADRARALRNHGMRRRYFHDEVGWNSRLDTLQAAVLLVKIRYIAQWNQRRREVAALYDHLFQQAGLATSLEDSTAGFSGVVLPFIDHRGVSVFHQYVVRIGGGRRDQAREFLRRRNIGSEIYYPLPLHLQPALQSLGYRAGDFPVAERAAQEVLALPIYPELTPAEQERIVATLGDFFRTAL
jgi:dTDP-4-amino-4,6-dideoxygalactose transaminase